MKTILTVAAHPDDEILGVGGTIARHAYNGDKAYALILGEGQTSRSTHRENTNRGIVDELHKNTLKSAEIIGYEDVFFANFPDNRFDNENLLDIVKVVEKYISNIKPQIIYTHYGNDLNIDHQYTAMAVLTASRPIGNYSVDEIYAFETLSSSEWNFDFSSSSNFKPNVFVNITEYYVKKEQAMRCYVSELCDFPHPRSIEGMDTLSKLRGMTAGIKRAEAFMLLRKVIK